MKREDARIYVYAHRPVEYGLPDNSLYQPLQIGFGEKFLELSDDTGDNIHEWNGAFAEMTGMYWVWKNRPENLKYIGQTQYRRVLEFDKNENFDELFKKYDIVIPAAIKFSNCTVAKQYSDNHSLTDLFILRDCLQALYPDYLRDFEKYVLNGRVFIYSNGFVMKAADFDSYCTFYFSLMEAFKVRKMWRTPADVTACVRKEIEDKIRKDQDGHVGTDGRGAVAYQTQVPAFLSERILTLWVLRNFKKHIYVKDYTIKENTTNREEKTE